MARGIVLVDDTTVGEFTSYDTTDETQLVIRFVDKKDLDKFIHLADEHGASLQFLTTPEVE